MQNPRHSLPKASVHEGREWFNSQMLWLCPQTLLFGQLCTRTEMTYLKVHFQLICKGGVEMHSWGYQGKQKPALRLPQNYHEISWRLCVSPHPYVGHTGSKRVSNCQRSFQEASLGILNSVLCSWNKTHRISAFCLSFFHTEEVLQPKLKLLLEWKEHMLFRTYKSVFIKTHIKGR